MRATACALMTLLLACANHPGTGEGSGPSPTDGAPTPSEDSRDSGASASTPPSEEGGTESAQVADVVGVEVSGDPGSHTFAVTLRSPDTGCERYADWWEVVDADQALVYRRILAHSHVDEQPFTRSGGPVEVSADARLWVRAHMHGEGTQADGYGGQVYVGSVAEGFSPEDASELAPLHQSAPLPDGCAF